jgi:hypothetical protein
VIFYGVAEEPEGDVLRLTISAYCVPESDFVRAVRTGWNR